MKTTRFLFVLALFCLPLSNGFAQYVSLLKTF